MKGMGHGSDYKQVHRDKQTNKNPKNPWTQHPIYYKKQNPRGDILTLFPILILICSRKTENSNHRLIF